MSEATDVAALAREAERHHSRSLLEGDEQSAERTHDDESWVVLNPDGLRPTPRRSAGIISVFDAPGFIAAVQQRTLSTVDGPVEPRLYVDEDTLALVAVLNDDDADRPGWRDYRVSLGLRQTPEWKRWLNNQGLHEQEKFATFIEDGQDEIVDPAPARMLEIAQTFEARISGRFRQQSRLGNGARTLLYEEEVEATSGGPGSKLEDTVQLPERMTIAVRPFYGACQYDADEGAYLPARYSVEALLKFRLAGGKLQIGWKLVRPEEVIRSAFGALRDQVAEALAVTPIAGPAPAAVPVPPIIERR